MDACIKRSRAKFLKKRYVLFFFILILGIKTGTTQSLFYYTPIGNVYFEGISNEKILVKFKEDLTTQQKNDILKNYIVLTQLNSNREYSKRGNAIKVNEYLTDDEVLYMLDELMKNQGIVFANPYYFSESGNLLSYTNKVIVKLSSEIDLKRLISLADSLKISFPKEDKYMSNVYHLELTKECTLNTIETSNFLYETGLFEYTEPMITGAGKSFSEASNDPYYSSQWAIPKMKVDDAWDITMGDENIKIAILDNGVEMEHADLENNILAGYDWLNSDNDPSPLLKVNEQNAHGTACAGIVAAEWNNTIGISGIVPDCKVIPVKFSENDEEGNWVGIITPDIIALAINYSWDEAQADILSCSWGWDTYSATIADAIWYATVLGRNGYGCPVFFASGNDNSQVSFPAYLSNVIAVGATNISDERVDHSVAGDWGSNYGDALDIVAPGEDIYTTDLSAEEGYNTNIVNGDYFATYSGTSAACPQAAGVMALLLSDDPLLTLPEARYILETTCDKIGSDDGTYEYATIPGHINGSWNEEVGYGRINAFAALDYLNNHGSECEADFTFNGVREDLVVNIDQPVYFNSSLCYAGSEGSEIVSYDWVFGDGATSTEVNPVHTYAEVGVYSPILTIQSQLASGGWCGDQKPYWNEITVSPNMPVLRTWVQEDESGAIGFIGLSNSSCYLNLDIADNLLENPGFEFSQCNIDLYDGVYTCKEHYPFDQYPICVDGSWFSSHGTPQYCKYPDLHMINEGNSLYLGTVANRFEGGGEIIETYKSEGLFYELDYPFLPGFTYKLKFNAWKVDELYYDNPSTIEKVNIALTSGLENDYQPLLEDCDQDEVHQHTPPENSFSLHELGFFHTAVDLAYRCYEVLFTVPFSNLDQIWIYPETLHTNYPGLSNYFGHMHIDDFILTRESNCMETVVFENNTNLPSLTKTSDQIIARNGAEVLNEQAVVFQAESLISLQAGFAVRHGASFAAFNETCTSTPEEINSLYTNHYYAELPAKVHFFNNSLANLGMIPSDSHSDRRNMQMGIFEINDGPFEIIPNPSNGLFRVSLKNGKNCQISLKIKNSFGQTIFKKAKMDINYSTINISSSPPGLYTLVIEKDNVTYIEKLIVN
ncbi:MAG: S8 family serine peptidase [Bacteroidales bacterium]|nr:S8 family serine peptidase [Bacteroidales bacterium]